MHARDHGRVALAWIGVIVSLVSLRLSSVQTEEQRKLLFWRCMRKDLQRFWGAILVIWLLDLLYCLYQFYH